MICGLVAIAHLSSDLSYFMIQHPYLCYLCVSSTTILLPTEIGRLLSLRRMIATIKLPSAQLAVPFLFPPQFTVVCFKFTVSCASCCFSLLQEERKTQPACSSGSLSFSWGYFWISRKSRRPEEEINTFGALVWFHTVGMT